MNKKNIIAESIMNKEFNTSLEWAKGYGRLEGTLKSIIQLIDTGLIRDLTTVNELIESRLRKEKKERINHEYV